MAMENWDPNEIARLRMAIERIQKDINEASGRLGELEQIALQRFSAAPQISQSGTPQIDSLRAPPPLPTSKLTSEGQYHPAAAAASKIDEAQFDDSEYVLPPEPAAQRTSQSTPHKQYAGPIAPAPSAPAKRNRAEELPRNSIDWETLIGGRWMTWVGAFTLLLAIGFGIHWAWTQLETPPWLRVVGFHLLGVAFLAAAHFLNRRGVPLAVQALVGLGIFTLYASAFAALHLYGLFSEQGAFVECAGITALAIGLAIRANSPAVVLLGALGGYLTPILTAHDSGNYAGLFTYLAFLNVALFLAQCGAGGAS